MIAFDRFVKFFVIICIAILALIGGFNYYIDPAGIFNNRKVDAAVNYLVNGQPVIGLTNFDERIFKKELLLNSPKTETIVLGSSRAMGIIADFDKDNNSFGNYSVSGANFNDDIALLSVYFEKNRKAPKKVVLAVEPWTLNKNRGDTRWKSLEKEYYEGLKLLKFSGETIKEIDAFSYTFEKIKTLFSISYLRNSIKDFRQKDTMPKAVSQEYNETSIILPYGSVKYGNNINHLPLEKISQNADSYIANKSIYQLNNFTGLNKNDVEKFKSLIKFLKANNTEIILWLPPYHPKVYDFIAKNEKYKNAIAAENFFVQFAEKENLKIYGAYNPAECSVTEIDFSDGMHLRSSGYTKIFKDKF